MGWEARSVAKKDLGCMRVRIWLARFVIACFGVEPGKHASGPWKAQEPEVPAVATMVPSRRPGDWRDIPDRPARAVAVYRRRRVPSGCGDPDGDAERARGGEHLGEVSSNAKNPWPKNRVMAPRFTVSYRTTP